MTEEQIIEMLDIALGFKSDAEETQTVAEDECFYMCYVEGADSPTVKHSDIESARAEAERLTLKMGKPTYLLHAVARCEPDKRLDVLGLVAKARDLGHEDIAKALLTCSVLVKTAVPFIPKIGEFPDLWRETEATLNN